MTITGETKFLVNVSIYLDNNENNPFQLIVLTDGEF